VLEPLGRNCHQTVRLRSGGGSVETGICFSSAQDIAADCFTALCAHSTENFR
jgi:hypothetical protein